MPSQGLGTVEIVFAEREGMELRLQYAEYQLIHRPAYPEAMNWHISKERKQFINEKVRNLSLLLLPNLQILADPA